MWKIYIYVCISTQPLSKRQQKVTEIRCQEGRRVEVEYGVLRSYRGGDCNKEGAAGALLWQDRTTFCVEHLIYGEIKRHENI